MVEQDLRFIKWRIKNSLGFKSFESAKRILNGIEVVQMLRKNQMLKPGTSMFKSFCKLTAKIHPPQIFVFLVDRCDRALILNYNFYD